MEHVLAALTPANRLVCRVCVATGLRVGDVVAFRTADLKPQFWITEQKTGKSKRVNLTKELYGQLKAQAGPVWVFTSPKSLDTTGHVKPSGGTLNGPQEHFACRRMWVSIVSERFMPLTRWRRIKAIWQRCRRS